MIGIDDKIEKDEEHGKFQPITSSEILLRRVSKTAGRHSQDDDEDDYDDDVIIKKTGEHYTDEHAMRSSSQFDPFTTVFVDSPITSYLEEGDNDDEIVPDSTTVEAATIEYKCKAVS